MGLLKGVFTFPSSSSIQISKPITMLHASFTYFSSSYTMLRTHNIAWMKFYLLFPKLNNDANPKHCLTQVLLFLPSPIQCCKSITLLDASFTCGYSPYTIFRTHNIPWGNFYLLLFNIVNREKWRETQKCLVSTFPQNCCQWLSEKSLKCCVRYFTVPHIKSNWRHAFNHYVSFI